MASIPIRRRKKREKSPSFVSVLHSALSAVVLVLVTGYFAFPPGTSESNPPNLTSSTAPDLEFYPAAFRDLPLPGPSAERAVFPYSVIPGGVFSSKEMNTALSNDTIVKEHYADFKVEKAQIIRVAADRKAYVSYRKGNRIFWSRKQVTLHEGETLLSDGEHLARTRCGNRVSAVPHSPVSPHEPEETALDAPIGLQFLAVTTNAIPADPVWIDFPSAPIVLTAMNLGSLPMPAGIGGGQFPVGMPPIGCCFATAPSSQPGTPLGSQPPPEPNPQPGPGVGPEPGPLPGPPPIATPESSSLMFLGAGLAGIILASKLRRN
jgi:hypothetical protein